MKITDQDRAILRELQRDVTTSLAMLSERLDMAQSTLWRRINELEKAGAVRGKVAVLDAAKVGLGLCVLAQVSLEDHSEDAIKDFARLVETRPEILECLKVSGMADYVLKIMVADVEAYEAFQTRYLLRNKWVRSIQSSFVLKEVKATTALPL